MPRSIRLARRTAIALTVPALLAATAVPAADAAGPRPLFQAPYACGQTWEATTYENHWPDQDSIDLGQWSDDDDNISDGEPALASAAGTIKKVYQAGNGENRVFIDHGGGWETYYIHLQSVPPLTVGQKVAQGEQVGRIGRSGADEYHLHYTQLKDGKAVRVAFDGKEIATHAGDESSWGKWPSRTGEQLTSRNCPAEGLAPFSVDGKVHVLSYKSQTGVAGVVRLRADGKGAEANTWSAPVGRRWTSITPFSLGGKAHQLRYASSTGAVSWDRLGAGGPTSLLTGTWGKNWTHIKPLAFGPQTYLLAYDQLSGHAAIDRVNADGKGSAAVQKLSWTKGWTSVEPFTLSGGQFLALYRGSTGQLKIVKLTPSASTVSVSTVSNTTIPAGQSHVLPLVQNGAGTILSYDALTAVARFQKFSPDGVPYANAVATAQWTKGWTTFTPFVISGRPHVLLNKSVSGETGVVKLDAGFTSATKIGSQTWSTGLS